ncbi:MAG: wax ester/triacylglycerol synthase family O-acyltransferase [Halioglobus sp.]
MYQLSGVDNLMIEGEKPAIPLHMSAAMLYDNRANPTGGIKLKRLRETLTHVVNQHFPILRCKLEELPLRLDKGYWVTDDNFDIQAHTRRVALPTPKNWSAFYKLFGEFHASPLTHDKPLWEIILVTGLDQLKGIPPGSSALFLKIHHAMMDGTTAMRLMRGLHSTESDPKAPLLIERSPISQTKAPDFHAPPWWMRYGTAWRHTIERPLDLTAMAAKMLPHLLPGRASSHTQTKMTVPKAHFNQPLSPDRVIGHVRMSLPKLRKITERYHCTLNDVALCVVGGALRNYLLSEQVLPDESLVAAMPINVRHEKRDGDIGNEIGMARIHMHTQSNDIEQRLQHIIASTHHSKSTHGKDHPNLLMNLIDDIHPAIILVLSDWLVASGYIDRMPPLVNTIVSNVPGLNKNAYIQGSKLVDYLGFGPLAPGVALFHTISSTTRHLNISFTSTAELCGDGHQYCKALDNSYKALLAALR